MCGITGICHFDTSRQVNSELLKKMCDTIIHRGPDGEGFYIGDNVGLGHRRLSIIDLETGDQPMYDHENDLILVFNGEIYNYIELREELLAMGHQFKTQSDTEVLLKCYLQWGEDCLNHLNGMWSFALWDAKKKRLFLSRDRIGEKPLYYAVFDNSFLFGSEMKTIIEYGHPKEINMEVLELYLTLSFIPAPHTFYKNILELPAGHYILVEDGQIKVKKYWDLPPIDEKNMLTNKEEIYEKFEYLLKDAVKIRMRADVPYGAFLSGGLDSSSIVALMSEISTHPVETFTIGFKEKAFDESHLAQLVADKFNTNHHKDIVTPDSFGETIGKIMHHYDHPFGDSSAIPTGYVSRYAREKVKMVLTGDGGDEALSGYTIYQGDKFASSFQKLPKFIRYILPQLTHGIGSVFTGNLRYKLNRAANVFDFSNLPFNQRLIEKASDIRTHTIRELLSGSPNSIKSEDYFKEYMGNCSYQDTFYKTMYFHLKLSLPNDMLVKVDRMSMANSLETRIPFLDHRILELMVHVHKDVKLQGYERKSILRKTVGKKLPQELLHAPKKGFAVPLREWFRDSAFQQVLNQLTESVFLDRFEIHKSTMQKLINESTTGKKDHANFLWSLLLLHKWHHGLNN